MDRIVFARSVLRRCGSVFVFFNLFRLRPAAATTAFALVLTGGLAAGTASATPAVGVLAGNSGVSPSGAATYNIPVGLPPGTHGMQPSLALSYNSQSGDGWAGYGWNLSGLSSITRCAATIDDDNLTRGIVYTTSSSYSDDFCLDDQRLRFTGGGYYGADGSTYDTEIASFAVITAHADSNATQGPSWFTVQTKDGRKYEYGNTTDSKIYALGTTVVRTWALDRVTDADGNYMTYQYSGNANAGLEYWPHYINYTGNGSTQPDHTIQFDFENRPSDIRSWYTAGSEAQNSMMLQDIKVIYSGTATFTYNLTYQQDASNGRNLLSTIQECGNDGTCLPATIVAWTGGGTGQVGWLADQSTGITVADGAHANALHVMDVDGDGIDDLVYPDPTSGDWKVAFGVPGGGFASAVDTGDPLYGDATYYQYAMAMNYDGTDRTSLMVPIPGGWQVLVPTGNRTAGAGGIFLTPPNSIPSMNANNSVTQKPMYEGNVWMASSTGNGLSDMLNNTGSALQLQLHQGPGGSGFAAPTTVVAGSTLQNLINHNFADVGLDFDGSGRFGTLAYNGTSWLAYTSPGVSTTTLSQMGAGITGKGVAALPIDFNGDGLTDLITVNTTGQYQVSISTGTGFVTKPTNTWYITGATLDPVIADYYGNGTQAAIIYSNTSAGAGWNLIGYSYSPAGGNFNPTWSSISAPYPTTNFLVGSLRVGHIDASGMDDLVYATGNSTSGYTFHYMLHAGTNGAQIPDLVSKVTDGLGNYCQFQYASLAAGSIYALNAQNDPATYPIENIQPAMQAVSAYTVNDGAGSWYTLSYGYSGAQYDLTGHGFLGFYNETITDSRNGNVKWLYYNQVFPGLGQVTNESDYITVNGNSLVVHSENNAPDYLVYGSGNNTLYLPYLNTAVAHDYDLAELSNGGTQGSEIRRTVTGLAASTSNHTSSTSFDTYGNVLDATTTVMDSTSTGLSYETETKSSFPTVAQSNNCVSLPSSVQVTRSILPSGDSESRTTTYALDPVHCQLAPNPGSTPSVSVTSSVSGAPTISASYSYDPFGNIASTTVSGTNVSSTLTGGGRSSGATFGGNGELPTASSLKVSDTLSLISSAAWRYDLGEPSSTTDANGNPTSMQYDAYGRTTKVTRPDNSAGTQSYQWCNNGQAPTFACPASASYEIVSAQVSSSGASITTGYAAYDSFGRVVEKGTVLLGGALSIVDTTYDSYGHVIATTKPYLSGTKAAYSTTTSYYNQVGLPHASYSPQNASDGCSPVCQDATTYSYSGFTTTINRTSGSYADLVAGPAGQSTISRMDAIGETVQVVDNLGGSTSYSYDAFGDLIRTVDADNKQTTLSYDGMGHKIGMVDPNMGTWAYQVDALGEVLCQTDANGQSIILGYDNVGRVVSKLEAVSGAGCGATTGISSNWTYDTQTKGLGLPTSVSDSNGFQRSYDYDGQSRPLDVTTTTTSGGNSYTVSTAYDTFGRIQTITYPSSPTPITAANAPTASASASPSTPDTGVLIALNGSNSSPNPSTLQYQWTQTGGPTLKFGAFDPAGETTSFTPTIGGIYTFQLQVIESNSALSAPASVSVTVKPVAPASAPTVTPPNPSTNGNVQLTWKSVTNVTSYDIYKSTDNVHFTFVKNVADNGTGTDTATVTSLPDGTYYFAIGSKVNNVSGNWGPSSAAENVLLPPPAPVQTGITLSNCVSTDGLSCNGIYTLNWNAAATATSYRIYQSSGGAYTWIDTVGTQTSRVEQATSNGGYWYYELACNASGCSGASNVESVGVQFPPTAPNTSANPSTISPGATSTISWSANSSPVSYFQVLNVVGTVVYSGTAKSMTVNPQYTKSWTVEACNTSGCSSGTSVTVTVNQGTGFVMPPKDDSVSGPALYAGIDPDHDSTISPAMAAPAPPSISMAAAMAMMVAPLPPIDPQPQFSVVEVPVAPPAMGDTAATLAALHRQREALVVDQPLQQDENALQAKVNRLTSSIPQTLALARPSENHPLGLGGQAVYAPPVYKAYASARPQPATGTSYRFSVQYDYDPASGALQSVADASTGFIYWRAATISGNAPVDAYGHLLAYVDGNNVSTVSVFDAATGNVTGVSTGVGNSTAIQQLVYVWDGFGNLQKRCDANRGLTEKPTYDGLNRLVTSQVYSGGAAGSCTPGSTTGAAMSLTYDAVGNINTRTNTGITVGAGTLSDTYTYGDPNHPYAVTGVTSIPGSYAYDANGNMLSGNGRTITWNDDNLPVTITTSGTQTGNSTTTGTSTFSYSPDLQRYEQTSTDGLGHNITTVYIGSLFEAVANGASTTQYRNNILAAGGIVAVHTIDQYGDATTAYIHSDHLGSSDIITDDTGAIAVDSVTSQQQVMSFDAFGLRRNPADWSYNLSSINVPGLKAFTDKGYTGQEQLDNVGLVHMNGRVYDPSIGRMVSADPRVPSPFFSQAFNRYAYVYNNPLNGIDPSGFDTTCTPSRVTRATGSSDTGCSTPPPPPPPPPATPVPPAPPVPPPLTPVAPPQMPHDLPTMTGTHIAGYDTGCTGCVSTSIGNGSFVYGGGTMVGSGGGGGSSSSSTSSSSSSSSSTGTTATGQNTTLLGTVYVSSSCLMNPECGAAAMTLFFRQAFSNPGLSYSPYLPTDAHALLTALICSEACGSYRVPGALAAAGYVPMNRINSDLPDFPSSSLMGNIYKPGAFAGVGSANWNATADPAAQTGPEAAAVNAASLTATGILNGSISDPTGGAVWMWATGVPYPGWLQQGQSNGTIGSAGSFGGNDFFIPIDPGH